MRVLVTDGENRAALAITRSLGRRGHEVIVGDSSRSSLAQASRYCASRVRYPDPVGMSEAFVDTLARIVRERAVDLLMPVSDITTSLVTAHRDRIACTIPCAAAAVIDRAADKADIMATAERIGVPVPRGILVRRASEAPADPGMGWPVVIKPWRSRVWTPHGWTFSSVSYAANARQLADDLARRPAHEFPVLLQERLVGPGLGVFACYHAGKPVALFSHRRLRERPPWGGVSVLCESADVHPEAGAHATRLLEEIGWQGVAMVEFKQDSRDGVPRLMEINGRFWGSLQLAIDAGVDFPALLVDSVTGREVQPPEYRVGVRNRWFWGDVDSLLVTLFGARSAPVGYATAHKLRAAGQFLEMWAPNLYYDNPKWDDRGPFIAETRHWFGKLTQGLRSTRAGEVTVAGSAVRPVNGAVVERAPAEARRSQVRCTSSFDEIELDEKGWNQLAASGSTNSIFQTHQWARSWLAAYGDEHEPLFITVQEGGRTRAVAPLMIDRSLSRERVIRFLGDGRSDYCDFLAPSAEPHVTSMLVTALLASRRWDRLELNNIPAGSHSLPIILECCSRQGFPVLMGDEIHCPTLLVQGHEANALAILNKPSLRRKQNYFERSGRLAVRHLNRAAEVSPLLDRFFEQHIGRWAATENPSLFLDDRNREFYRALTESLGASPWLLFTVLEFDDHPVAFHFGFDYNGSVTWYKPSFDTAFASWSPGLTLLRNLIAYALEHERHEVDFTVGDEAFKSRFTNSVRRAVRLQVFRDPVRLKLERANRSLRAAVKRARPSEREPR